MTPTSGQRLLTGWGRTAPTRSLVSHPQPGKNPLGTLDAVATLDDVSASVTVGASRRGVIARGLGRSYGDAAQNAGGSVLDLTGCDRVLQFDGEAGLLTVQGGASFDALMRMLLPQGWFLPVTPGTRQVTVGGALAADVHGKNHHADGSIGSHVSSMVLGLADGTEVTVSPELDADLFWATMGGLGLTGIILSATIRLLPVTSSWMAVDTERATNLDELLEAIARADRFRYSVAWIDCLAKGRQFGRGVVTAGDHLPADQVPAKHQAHGHDFAPRTLLRAPGLVPPGLLSRPTIAAFNEAWFRKAPRQAHAEPESLATFFHPLDGVDSWNRLYGPRGFVQWQCVVPDEATLRTVLHRLNDARVPSFLAVLKRFGAGNLGPLSFPRPGWTLALDVPAAVSGLVEVLDSLDEVVADAGGSIYLVKDARLRPELLGALYPDLERWRAVRARVDPNRVFMSDLARRLAI